MAPRKYQADNLTKAFFIAVRLREEMLGIGFTDNGGAIHSAERIVNLLGLALNHANISHINNLKLDESAEWSEAAYAARARKEELQIEHVSPLRALTRGAIKHIKDVPEDRKAESLQKFVKENYRLALLTRDETAKLNKHNRSKMTADRLGEAGIKMRPRNSA